MKKITFEALPQNEPCCAQSKFSQTPIRVPDTGCKTKNEEKGEFMNNDMT